MVKFQAFKYGKKLNWKDLLQLIAKCDSFSPQYLWTPAIQNLPTEIA